MNHKTLAMTDHLYEYILSVTLRDSDILSRLREETGRLPYGRMQIAPDQGQFMAMLIKLLGARKCLEVGTFTGYSSLSVALALPADGTLVCCDVSEEWTSIARRYWAEAGVADKVTLRLAPALETLDQLLADGGANTFDFAFIDADKGNYEAYYERALQLMRPGGLITVDNVLWSGKVAEAEDQKADTQALRAFNEKRLRDDRIDLSMLSIGDGLTLARKKA